MTQTIYGQDALCCIRMFHKKEINRESIRKSVHLTKTRKELYNDEP